MPKTPFDDDARGASGGMDQLATVVRTLGPRDEQKFDRLNGVLATRKATASAAQEVKARDLFENVGDKEAAFHRSRRATA